MAGTTPIDLTADHAAGSEEHTSSAYGSAPGAGTRPRAKRDLIRRAINGDREALLALVQTFVPADEHVLAYDLVGTFGLIFRTRAFFCVTSRRIVSIETGPFRSFRYIDAYLEHVNSSGIGQPSRLKLYRQLFVAAIFCVSVGAAAVIALLEGGDVGALAAPAAGLTFALFLLVARLISSRWRRSNKTGLFLNVADGIDISSFVDSSRFPTAVHLYQDYALARERRLALLS